MYNSEWSREKTAPKEANTRFVKGPQGKRVVVLKVKFNDIADSRAAGRDLDCWVNPSTQRQKASVGMIFVHLIKMDAIDWLTSSTDSIYNSWFMIRTETKLQVQDQFKPLA